MALCVHLSAPTIEAVAGAFAANDALMKSLAVVCAEHENESVEAIGVEDEYFLAPHMIVPVVRRKRKNDVERPAPIYWFVFTGNKVRGSHFKAVALLKKQPMRLLGSTDDIEEGALGTKSKRSTWTFFRDDVNEGVCLKMIDFAVAETCRILEIVNPGRDAFRAMVDAKLSTMVEGRVADAPLDVLDEWSEQPFKSISKMTKEEQNAFERARDAMKATREAERKADAEEKRRNADIGRMTRYKPTMTECTAMPVPTDDADLACRYVFDVDEDGDSKPRTACPYDRKAGTAFCSMCAIMIAMA